MMDIGVKVLIGLMLPPFGSFNICYISDRII
jgi:hypothetical protein